MIKELMRSTPHGDSQCSSARACLDHGSVKR
jgi:hypothetical protein